MSVRMRHVVSFLGVSLAVTLGWSRPAGAQHSRVVEDGPVHEAFVPSVTDVVALDAIEHEPPPEITERIPAKCDPNAVWIKGYWDYVEEPNEGRDHWVWTGGSWRIPPPGRHWIDGFWREYDAGWVRVDGFWSGVPADGIAYIEDAPPEPFDEDPPDASGRGYFWHAGYWHYSPDRGYERRSGRWEELDPNLVLVPAHYVWRPDGYVFVTAYWDYPIDRRGCVYQTIYVEPAARVAYVYEPAVIVEPDVVVGRIYYSYPNYTYLLHHHYHHHHAWWHEHHDVPTWWGWHSWWGLRWHDHWGAWWWYTHPGYPSPHFITSSHAALIYAPSQKTVIKIKNVVKKPVIITNNGVISSGQTLQIAAKGKIRGDKDDGKKGKSAPMVFAKSSKEKAADLAVSTGGKKGKDDKDDPKLATLMPTGTKKAKPDDGDDDPKKHPRKPKTGKDAELLAAPGGAKSGAKSPFTTDTGKGKTKDDDKDKEKLKGKPSDPPIRAKAKSDDKPGGDKPKDKDKGMDKPKGKSDDKPKGPPITGSGGERSKEKDKGLDKPKDKGGDKGGDKPKGPPITGPGGGERAKEKDKGSDKPKDRPGDKPKGGDRAVDDRPGDKPKGSGGDFKPKDSGKERERDKPAEVKPPKTEVKPPKGDDKPKPPAATGGGSAGGGSGGGGSGGKDKDKDKDGGKKKDRDRN